MLKESPTAFGSDFAESARQSIDYFRTRATDEPENFIVGAFQNDRLIGTAGGVREQTLKRRHLAMVVGMYVHPDSRQHGLGARLLEAVLNRLDGLAGVERIELAVTAGNEPALRLYQRAGFEVYGREPAALKVAGLDYDEFLLSRTCPR